MARRMRKRFGATPTEALWRDACRGAVRRPMRKHSGPMPADALWRDAYGSAMARRDALRKRSVEETAAEALWSDAC